MALTGFTTLALPKDSAFNDAHLQSQLQKWDLAPRLRTFLFRYSKPYHKLQAQELVTDLLNDDRVREVFQVLLRSGQWSGLQGRVVQVDAEVVPTTLTRLDLFDRLREAQDPPIVRPNGDLAKCMDDVRDGFQVCDRLREALLVADSEHADLVSPGERGELLWRLFEHVALGGACCQYEDRLDPYVAAAVRLYKELLRARRNTHSGGVEVASVVYCVRSVTTDAGAECAPLFPHPSRNSFCYVAVDVTRRTCRVLYHAHAPYW